MIEGLAHVCLTEGSLRRVFSTKENAIYYWLLHHDADCDIRGDILYIDGVPHEAIVPFIIDPEIYG